jgi:hypothetical protein
LVKIEELWRNEFKFELDEYKLEKEEIDLQYSGWKELYKQASKNPEKKRMVPIRPDDTLAEPLL